MGHRRNNRLNIFRYAKNNYELRVTNYELSWRAYKIDTLIKQNLLLKFSTTESIATYIAEERFLGYIEESLGQLVLLGFDVTVFTPAAYLRRRLQRPSMEFSSCGWLRT